MSVTLLPIDGLHMDLQISHYLAFTAFIQLAVALNFGLVFLDSRSGLLRLKRKLFNNYKASNTRVVGRVANILKRYRSDHDYDPDTERAHTKTKQYHSIVTSDWDDEQEISFFPALGVIYGFYSLTLLFLICFFDVSYDSLFYQNQFLILSQVTMAFSVVLIIRSWCKNTVTHITRATLIYIFFGAVGWICCCHGWMFDCDISFSRLYHWYILLSYLPIIYYVLRIMLIFLHKTLYIFPMTWWAAKFNAALNKEQQS